MTGPEPDPAVCPLCRKTNDCGMARGEAACWCFNASIRPDTIERVPDEARGRACVCRTCATGWRPPGKHGGGP